MSETTAALRFWLLTGGSTAFRLCKPFSCKACPKISVNPFHARRVRERTYHGRGGSERGTAGRQGEAGPGGAGQGGAEQGGAERVGAGRGDAPEDNRPF